MARDGGEGGSWEGEPGGTGGGVGVGEEVERRHVPRARGKKKNCSVKHFNL